MRLKHNSGVRKDGTTEPRVGLCYTPNPPHAVSSRSAPHTMSDATTLRRQRTTAAEAAAEGAAQALAPFSPEAVLTAAGRESPCSCPSSLSLCLCLTAVGVSDVKEEHTLVATAVLGLRAGLGCAG